MIRKEKETFVRVSIQNDWDMDRIIKNIVDQWESDVADARIDEQNKAQIRVDEAFTRGQHSTYPF